MKTRKHSYMDIYDYCMERFHLSRRWHSVWYSLAIRAYGCAVKQRREIDNGSAT